jgi:hypothetical protein
MSEKSDKTGLKKNLASLSGGLSTGLKVWLFFLFCFYFLKYSVPLSILLGAVGGLASTVMVAWWKSKDEPSASKRDNVEPGEDSEDDSSHLSGIRLARQRRRNRGKTRSPSLLKPLSGFFEKSHKRTRKRRRRVIRSNDDSYED